MVRVCDGDQWTVIDLIFILVHKINWSWAIHYIPCPVIFLFDTSGHSHLLMDRNQITISITREKIIHDHSRFDLNLSTHTMITLQITLSLLPLPVLSQRLLPPVGPACHQHIHNRLAKLPWPQPGRWHSCPSPDWKIRNSWPRTIYIRCRSRPDAVQVLRHLIKHQLRYLLLAITILWTKGFNCTTHLLHTGHRWVRGWIRSGVLGPEAVESDAVSVLGPGWVCKGKTPEELSWGDPSVVQSSLCRIHWNNLSSCTGELLRPVDNYL